jgi:GNAT superfamily N-acetyltransferase
VTNIICREATREDLPEILRLYAQPELDDGRILALNDAERLFERMAAYPDYRIYVALDGEAVVGTFAMLVMDNLGHMGTPSAIVEDVAVDPQRHGRGIGRAMMQHAMTLSASKGCYKLTLSSNLKRSKAHAFYEAIGFERHGYSFRWCETNLG